MNYRKIQIIEIRIRESQLYEYKNNSLIEEFDKYDNASDLIDKIRDGEIRLEEAKNDQAIFKSHLGGIKKGNPEKNQMSKKTQYAILK